MKNLILTITILIFQFNYAQLDPNGVLILNSGTTAEINAISPEVGALVFNTDTHKTYVYDGTTWVIASGTNENWTISGNNQYSAVSGNVGIGTTSPDAKLTIGGGTENGSLIVQSNGGSDWLTVGTSGAGIVELNSQGGQTRVGGIGNLGARMNIGPLTRSTVPLAISGVVNQAENLFEVNDRGDRSGNMFVITNLGNVGIGTTSPSAKLDVNGRINSRADGGLNYVASGIHLYSHNDYRGAGIFSFGQTKDWFFGNPYTDHDGKFIIAVANKTGNESVAQISNAQFTVQNNGNIGIGTANPSTKLEVAGQVKITGGTPGAGKILTSDANGLATWQNSSNVVENNVLVEGENQSMFGNSPNNGSCIVSHGIATFFTNTNDNNYIHIKLPYKIDTHNDMYHIKATGYRYGASKVIDITWVGYCYKDGSALLSTSNTNSGDPEFNITQYVGSDNHIYLRFRGTTGSNYYQSFRIDSMNVGNGSVLRKGDVQIISSASANL